MNVRNIRSHPYRSTVVARMREVLLYDAGDLRLVESLKPKVESNDILVRVRVCAVCPTDIRKYKHGARSHLVELPMNLGHEWAGDVIEVGKNVKDVKVGTRVLGGGFAGYAEYAKIDRRMIQLFGRILELPEEASYEEATFVEPLADCIHSIVEQAKTKIGDYVYIAGAGQMGLQHMMVAKMIGAWTIVSEIHESRIEWAKKLGADFVINPTKEDPMEAVKEITEGAMANSAIATIGVPEVILQCIKVTRTKGRVVIFGGAPKGTIVELDPNLLHYSEIELTGSSWIGIPPHHNPQLYPLALGLIGSKKIQVGQLITHRFPLEEIHKAFELVEKKEALKAIIQIQ